MSKQKKQSNQVRLDFDSEPSVPAETMTAVEPVEEQTAIVPEQEPVQTDMTEDVPVAETEEKVEEPVAEPVTEEKPKFKEYGVKESKPKATPSSKPEFVKTEEALTIINYTGRAVLVPATAESVKACWDARAEGTTPEMFEAELAEALGCEPQATYRGTNVRSMILMNVPLAGLTRVDLY